MLTSPLQEKLTATELEMQPSLVKTDEREEVMFRKAQSVITRQDLKIRNRATLRRASSLGRKETILHYAQLKRRQHLYARMSRSLEPSFGKRESLVVNKKSDDRIISPISMRKYSSYMERRKITLPFSPDFPLPTTPRGSTAISTRLQSLYPVAKRSLWSL